MTAPPQRLFLLEPQYRERVWGGQRLKAHTPPIGELWGAFDDSRIRTGPLAGQSVAELANAFGAAFLGDDVLSAKNVAPTLLLNYHFFEPSDRLRPYVGAGINYTRFTDVKSSLASDVELGSSTGLALQAGFNYAIAKDWGLFASVAKIDVKSKVVAAGATVLTTTVDFRPIVYSAGFSFQF